MPLSELEFEIACKEINLKKKINVIDRRNTDHPEFNDWNNFRIILDRAASVLGYCYYPKSFGDYLMSLPEKFSYITSVEKIFKILGDWKGIIKFVHRHGKSTFSRYSDDYESLRILTTSQPLKYHGKIMMGKNAWPRIEFIEHISTMCNGIQNPTVLDAGCGTGLNMYLLAKSNPEMKISGFEYTHSRMASCIVNLIYESFYEELFLGDVTKIDLPDNSYDIVFTNHVLEQLGQASAELALKEVFRVCKKGAVLCEPSIHNANAYEKWRMTKLGYCRDLLAIAKGIPNCTVKEYKEDTIRNFPNTSYTLVLEKEQK
ncbi:MAG: class I SAM-dependent methyltransferase [Ignavibacteriales bacterium]|nr:class I SAM-dependent methyltransferase [Ignavibacteriales bacterium]